jgi:DNA repair photolyase
LTGSHVSTYFRLVPDPPDRSLRPPGRLVARGAADNPANRFERLHHVADPEEELPPDDDGAPPPVPTVYLRDPTRTLLAHNDSPDLGFDTSLNPYRGCEHGCSYCLAPSTPVLHSDLVWRPIGEVRVGDTLVGFDESPEPGATPKLRPAAVQAVWWSRKPTLRVVGRNTEVVTTAEHRWLQARSFRWSRTDRLAPGHLLRHLPVTPSEAEDDDYRAGYLAGLSPGDGTFRYRSGWRGDKKGFPAAYWRVAMIDLEPLERSVRFLESFGVSARVRPFDPGARTRSPMWKVEIRSLARLEILNKILFDPRESRGYRRGFLAGFFDAEGHDGSSLRISQVDLSVLERVRSYAHSLGFDFQLEPRENHASTLRLVGGVTDRIRFLSVCNPAIRRKRDVLFGWAPFLDPEPIDAIEPGPRRDVVDIQTSTGTFYAAGLATHNCYARPTHEYLGFSAGLDFETRILVKEEAPELLREALSSPRWQPRVVALSGVTDAYQPIEAKLRLTRRCLAVFAAFRNPVAIITKSALVARDADLLAELAAHGAASVLVSITTLDDALRRALEPRASSPRRRLAAIETLAKAGVPVGVMCAPVIPGLNDAEIPAILSAAARAGAQRASHVLLRLPHGVAELFDAWLARHRPERRDRVMARIREVRGGRLNDPRFHSRMRGEGVYADQIHALFALACRRAGLAGERAPLSTAAFRRPGGTGGTQLQLL